MSDTYLLYIKRQNLVRNGDDVLEWKTTKRTVKRGTHEEILSAYDEEKKKWAHDENVSVGWERDYSSYPKKYIAASWGRGAVLPVVCIGTKNGSTFWQSAVNDLSSIIREEREGKRARFHYIPQGYPAKALGLDPLI